MLDKLFELHKRILKDQKAQQKRYLYSKIAWDQRLNIIVGPRGVGKTTLMLQRLQDEYADSDSALYVSADNILVNELGLFNIAQEFEKLGGKVLVIDEVHKYKNWNQEVKNIYDSFASLKLLVSGSSAIGIVKSQYDLSRRAVLNRLKGLSFREYINFKLGDDVFPASYTFKAVAKNAGTIAKDIVTTVEKNDQRVLALFNDYLKAGYYPYFLEGTKGYLDKLQNALSKVLYEDIPSVCNYEVGAIKKFQKILFLTATSAPLVPNVSTMASDLGINKSTLYDYLESLKDAGIISLMFRGEKGVEIYRKPEKIFLENPNLFYSVKHEAHFEPNIGAVRETYAYNQLSFDNLVTASDDKDFVIDGYELEVGGKNKGTKYIKDKEADFVLKDGVEFAQGSLLPLWLIGFLY